MALLLASTISCIAATNTYSTSDLDIIVEVPTDLKVITRAVTSADPNLSLLNADAEELKILFSKYNIYMEMFPEDISYEIVISGNTTEDKGFLELNNSEFNEGLNSYKENIESSQESTVTEYKSYSNDKARFYMISSINKSPETTTYVDIYYTVMRGKAITFTMQSTKELSAQAKDMLKTVIDNTTFTEVKASLSESSTFNEIIGTVYALLIPIVILAAIIGIVEYANVKAKKKRIRERVELERYERAQKELKEKDDTK